MTISDVRDRASAAIERVRANPIVQRIETFQTPQLDWKAVLVVILTIFAAYFLGRWNAEDERDQWWREQIAAKSSSVREVMDRHQDDIDRADSLILTALEATDDRLSAAEAALKASRDRQSPDGCPRIPAVCMRAGPSGR